MQIPEKKSNRLAALMYCLVMSARMNVAIERPLSRSENGNCGNKIKLEEKLTNKTRNGMTVADIVCLIDQCNFAC